jgi:hypothetical protein
MPWKARGGVPTEERNDALVALAALRVSERSVAERAAPGKTRGENKMSLLQRQLFGDRETVLGRVVAYRPALVEIAGGLAATIFLVQVAYWWFASGRRPFYKFNAPCQHDRYRAGDSWQEELRLTRSAFESARRAVATKIRQGDSKTLAMETSLVLYWTDSNRLTWYQLNEPLLWQMLAASFGLDEHVAAEQVDRKAERAGRKENKRGERRTKPAVEKSEPAVEKATDSPVDNPAPQHYLAPQESRITCLQEKTQISKTDNGSTSLTTLPPLPADAAALETAPETTDTAAITRNDLTTAPGSQLNSTSALSATPSSTSTPAKSLPDAVASPFQRSSIPTFPWWDEARRILAGQMTRATYDSLLRGAQARLEGDGTVVITASAQVKPWLEGRWARAILLAVGAAGVQAQVVRVDIAF